VVGEPLASEVGAARVDDERAVEAGAGRAVHVVDEPLSRLDRKRNLKKALAGSDAELSNR
jgi:hypothetical protein